MRLNYFYAFVEFDHKQGMDWLKKTAERGNTVSQYILGKLILLDNTSSLGTTADARYWLERAAKGGDPDAIRTLESLHL
jgi:TPR repeat protein